ncbi:hypothetical protein NQ315_017391 [Exocentrus adspersus]|uniref:DUF4817 domain-containing protein n=1 Tax=Exocentrus adspersus TaxID=1586481 RepID=A0AAV8VL56_9CUCU|nr:hypothetical protein NQ315_017391 [Exocentrus adspersus]
MVRLGMQKESETHQSTSAEVNKVARYRKVPAEYRVKGARNGFKGNGEPTRSRGPAAEPTGFNVNNQTILSSKHTVEVDCGASVSCVNEQMYRTYLNKYALKLDSTVLKGYIQSQSFVPKGYFWCNVRLKKKEKSIRFYVIKNGGPMIGGRDFLKAFGITLSNINSISQNPIVFEELPFKEQLIQRFMQLEKNCFLAARIYAQKYPNGSHPDVRSLHNLKERFERTGSVSYEKKSRTPTVLNEENQLAISLAVVENPQVSVRVLSNNLNIKKSSISKCLQKNKFHPYHVQLHQALLENDFEKTIHFCQ